ncbi:NAD(P)-dependent dehydrogenase (short-subunit alcohol dehydrogenase family) [Pseudonocardia sediminis]|uniref:NAD(P)-dependent dehydrogenase (Short-subunit alcohol dehydrogenase family) n=1 Tax=Pseudonocardia sediminis TaxID=1397368 RepID=A0A4Q7UTG1_PSEST|nr:SDR family oxidoreductase [Pseudonocardia sediminis]RZT84294.1 NAD(P)-dependent dehydrogenase (short-subunit alcohol dehydrogenase family) [Pseudonocardia sediminis]
MADDAKTTVLITGANKGLGFTTARRLGEKGWRVLIGSRDAERGAVAARELTEDGLDVTAVTLDVTSDGSVAAAAARIGEEFGRLDVLVNNAGISGAHTSTAETGPDDVRDVYETNVFGPVRVTKAMIPLLERSDAPRIVMVSSGLGSQVVTADPERIENSVPGLAYQSSKAALNMLMSQYARALPGFRVNAADPGYTATDLNGNSGPQTVQEGTDAIVTLATVASDGPTGTFVDRDGAMPW